MFITNKQHLLYGFIFTLTMGCNAPIASHQTEDIQMPHAKHQTTNVRTPHAKPQKMMMPAQAIMHTEIAAMPEPRYREKRAAITANPVHQVSTTPVSTFSIDIDTGAYSNMRRWIQRGILPNPTEIRLEELINYFDYDYPIPKNTKQPFSVYTEISPTPWQPNTFLLHIGIQGYEPDPTTMPPANLVFLLDVSGSMEGPDRLGLLKTSLKMLLTQLSKKDTVSIVVYAGAAGVVLEPTPASQREKISRALDGLSAGGSTNGGAGIQLAYQLAKQAFIQGGINRVILASDGDVNVGTTDFNALLAMVKKQRESGIALTTLGFGMGNYNEHLMEQLADAGNGQHAYIDNLNEARKVLVDEVTSTLLMIAKDVKIQVEFNPTQVAEYRLIGYENRMLVREDFNNDQVDAGDIGVGHTVTALYEIALVGSQGLKIAPLRYGKKTTTQQDKSSELAFLRLRYKAPESDRSQLIQIPITKQNITQNITQTSDDFRFSAAVAAFGEILRGGKYTGDFHYDDVLNLAKKARGHDDFGYRSEFIALVRTTQALDKSQ